MTHKPTDKEVLQRAAALLADNLLPSLLPARLTCAVRSASVLEFHLSQAKAQQLAQQALQKRREKTK